jgi:hypothetical protein
MWSGPFPVTGVSYREGNPTVYPGRRPGRWDFDLPFTLPADQSHGGVRQAVAQCPGLGFGQGVRQAERP